MARYVLDFPEIDRTQGAVVGGKGAHLGELSRVEGISVPAGFCVTTDAFERVMAGAPSLEQRLERLARLKPDDRESIRTISAEIRGLIEGIVIPGDVAAAINASLLPLGEHGAWAIRSSATAEDLPTASFAGQHDTYLNVLGTEAILQHVSRCWASLFTERAVAYRLRNGFDHRKVHMAVVVQQMVFPQTSGVLFTADPISGNRKVVSLEASIGLGEALVSGQVNADVYKVRDGEIASRQVATQKVAIYASQGGGTQRMEIEQAESVLSDMQIVRLERLGRRIEAHFGCPQDIEWCLVDDDLHIVQSRPITTLFPIPAAPDGESRVYVSVGHQQMMTDPMKPLGLSLFKLTSPAPMHDAGGRLFVDVTRGLASPASRPGLLAVLGRSDPLIRDALETVLERSDFIRSLPEAAPGGAPGANATGGSVPAPLEADPAIVTGLIERTRASIEDLKRDIRGKSGPELLDFIHSDVQELKRILFDPKSHQVIMAAMEASFWLNEKLHEWLGEKNAADALAQSAPNNVTSEMGLSLLAVADVIRRLPDVVAFLERVEDEDFLDQLSGITGGREARDAIQAWLDAYGMRCVGEIDITRPRWSERTSSIVPLILGNVRNFQPGAGERRFEEGRVEAWKTEQEVLERLQSLPDGEQKVTEAKRMIDRVRTFSGYREYPKYGMINRYFIYKQALLQEAERLVQADVLRESEDIFYLTFQELQDLVGTNHSDEGLIRERKEAFRYYRSLTPPRVLTSDGEAIAGSYKRDGLPADALVGLAASAGTVEGRARVILDLADATLEADDILVTVYTDPSWTPAFVGIKGLVTEVGGLMTHGAVIAREYGLPAIVGVQYATLLIRDGQRIRVNGTEGYVELLP